MKRNTVIILLVLVVVGLGIGTFYISSRLTDIDTTAPENVEAYSTCSNACESGKECNSNGNPAPGKMWSCRSSKCVQEATNNGGQSCYLSCSGGWKPCGCDEDACNTACLAKIPASGGNATHTMTCGACKQLFTCECSKTVDKTPTNTPTGTPTGTPTPTSTPTVTPTISKTITPTLTRTISPTISKTVTPTITPTISYTITPTQLVTTIPPTALITDEIDRVLIGICFIFIGIFLYRSGAYMFIGNYIWSFGGQLMGNSINEKEKQSFERELLKKKKDE